VVKRDTASENAENAHRLSETPRNHVRFRSSLRLGPKDLSASRSPFTFRHGLPALPKHSLYSIEEDEG
jgi:hypothetical protein